MQVARLEKKGSWWWQREGNGLQGPCGSGGSEGGWVRKWISKDGVVLKICDNAVKCSDHPR